MKGLEVFWALWREVFSHCGKFKKTTRPKCPWFLYVSSFSEAIKLLFIWGPISIFLCWEVAAQMCVCVCVLFCTLGPGGQRFVFDPRRISHREMSPQPRLIRQKGWADRACPVGHGRLVAAFLRIRGSNESRQIQVCVCVACWATDRGGVRGGLI